MSPSRYPTQEDYLSSYETQAMAEQRNLVANVAMGLLLFMGIFALTVCILNIIAMWRIFKKAGRPGWAALIPIYNSVVLYQISGLSGWWVLTLCVPVVGIVVSIWQLINLSKAFGKSTGFTVGLIILQPIFMMILGFGSSQYLGTPQSNILGDNPTPANPTPATPQSDTNSTPNSSTTPSSNPTLPPDSHQSGGNFMSNE